MLFLHLAERLEVKMSTLKAGDTKNVIKFNKIDSACQARMVNDVTTEQRSVKVAVKVDHN